jgi:FkbM family methyltransferase
MRTKFYTKDDKQLDISTWDTSGSIEDLSNRYGWEGAMAYGNLIHDELNAYGPGIKPGDIYLDLGANIGMSAIRAESNGCSKIYCVEPDPGVFEALNKNKNYHWIVDNIAIGTTRGVIDISKWPNYWEHQPIPCITLDEFFDKHNITRIDYMKCDIEGNEKKVFREVSQITWDKIQKIFIEFHEEGDDTERSKFVQFFLDKGFNNYHVVLGFHQSFLYFWKG